MALEDKDLFDAVFAKYSDQPIEFIMEQYAKVKELNASIERRTCEASDGSCAKPATRAAKTEQPKKKRYSRKSLIVTPEVAIGKEHIKCCICGEKLKLITRKHLAKHGITPEEYRKLCGYTPKTYLMSDDRAVQMLAIAEKAQSAIRAKRKN